MERKFVDTDTLDDRPDTYRHARGGKNYSALEESYAIDLPWHNMWFRKRLMEALGGIGGKRAIDVLISHARNYADPAHSYARAALANIMIRPQIVRPSLINTVIIT